MSERANAAGRVKSWTRARFQLEKETTLLVTELESTTPGFPPLHTVVAFWTTERRHYHFKVFKPLEAVAEEDIPPAWYRDALAVEPGVDCGCC
jgi:nitrate reductase delta subunit